MPLYLLAFEVTTEDICRQVQAANDIWCDCGIVFNLTKIKPLKDVVININDFDFNIEDIVSADDFFTRMPNYPAAERLYKLKPC